MYFIETKATICLPYFGHLPLNTFLSVVCIAGVARKLRAINPKPHGSGRISPHVFQRPITQKGLKQKNRQNSAIPRKMSAE